MCAVIGVRIIPGCNEFTRMLLGASSSRADFVRPRMAHLIAVKKVLTARLAAVRGTRLVVRVPR